MGIFSKLFHAKDGDDVPLEVEEEPEEDGRSGIVSDAFTGAPQQDTSAPPPRVPPTSSVRRPRTEPPTRDASEAIPGSTRSVPLPNMSPPQTPPTRTEMRRSNPRAAPPVPVLRGDTERVTIEPRASLRPSVPVAAKPKKPKPKPTSSRAKSGASALARDSVAPELADDVDRAFAAVEHEGQGPAGPGTLAQDAPGREEVERLFRQIAAEHARHMRDFAFELSTGEPSRHWAELCAPSVGALRRAASKMQQAPLQKSLRRLEQAMEEARTSSSTRIGGPLRQRLLECLDSMREVLPEAFTEKTGERAREPIIVDALLRLVPGVHRLAIDKLYAAGIDSLAQFRAANAFDLARATGIDEALCRAIVERFAHHRDERAAITPDEERSHERARISELVSALRTKQAEFRDAEEEEDLPRKRNVRRLRRELELELELELAQLDEVELVGEIERYSVERKIQRLEAFLRPEPRRSTAKRPEHPTQTRPPSP
jgi:hypothetical protein